MTSRSATKVAVSPLMQAVLVGALGTLGVAFAHRNADSAPAIVAVTSAVAVAAALLRLRGLSVGALGVGAAAAFVSPDGLGPLLVVTGSLVACDVGRGDLRLAPWRDAIDGLIALPAFAGLAATAAAQPSARGMVVAVAAGLAVVLVVWRGPHPITDSVLAPVVSTLGALGAAAVAIAPERLTRLGELPTATVQAGRSVAAGVALFGLVVVGLTARSLRAGRVLR